MKKLLIFTLAIMLVAYATSFATLTRTLTMGDANGIVYDDANIWLYPSTFYNYPDLAIGELYSNDMEKFGIHYKFGEDNPMMIGFYFCTDQPFYLPFDDSLSWDSTEENNDRLDFFFGYMMGENPLGLHINYIKGSRKCEDDSIPPATSPNTAEEGISNLAFDFGITMMQGKADIAAGLNFLSFTDIWENGNDETKPTGNFAFYFAGRYFHEMNQKVTLVPHLGFSSEKVGFEIYDYAKTTWAYATTMTREYKYSRTTIDLGCGMNYSPAAGVMAIGDIGFMMYNTKCEFHHDTLYTGGSVMIDAEEKDNYTYLPYFRIGLDAGVFDWLDLRAGARSYWRKFVNENKQMTSTDKWTEKYTRCHVRNSTYLGAGFHWGNLKIDAEIDPELLLDGFYFISGEDNDMAYQITILYEMF